MLKREKGLKKKGQSWSDPEGANFLRGKDPGHGGRKIEKINWKYRKNVKLGLEKNIR